MKVVAGAILVGLALPAQAFPAINLEHMARIAEVATPEDLLAVRSKITQKRASTFDAAKQYISTKGTHAYVAPNFAAGDQRGPCPGLNALANHGYLPHSGVATLQQFIDVTKDVYGMAIDLGTFLAVYGTVFDGNAVSLNPGYSIGGPAPGHLSDNILGGLGILGTPQGLTGSHNKYESDASTTRGDLFVFGNNYDTQPKFFQTFYDSLKEHAPADEQYTAFADHHISRFDDSVHTNPYFFYSPFAGAIVTPAGWSFPCRMMANHSAEFPDGSLTKPILKTFFGITGKSGSFKYSTGTERIPDNWYRRPNDDFSIPAFLADVLEHGLLHPRLLSIGANTGKVDTFTPIDLGDLTGGVFNAGTLTQGNNLFCVAIGIIQALQPDILGSTYSDPKKAGQPLTDQITVLIQKYACPQLAKVNSQLYNQYPGYNSSQGAL